MVGRCPSSVGGDGWDEVPRSSRSSGSLERPSPDSMAIPFLPPGGAQAWNPSLRGVCLGCCPTRAMLAGTRRTSPGSTGSGASRLVPDTCPDTCPTAVGVRPHLGMLTGEMPSSRGLNTWGAGRNHAPFLVPTSKASMA